MHHYPYKWDFSLSQRNSSSSSWLPALCWLMRNAIRRIGHRTMVEPVSFVASPWPKAEGGFFREIISRNVCISMQTQIKVIAPRARAKHFALPVAADRHWNSLSEWATPPNTRAWPLQCLFLELQCWPGVTSYLWTAFPYKDKKLKITFYHNLKQKLVYFLVIRHHIK